MKRFLFALLSLSLSGCIPASVTNSPGAYGRVTDAHSGAPIAGATVTFPGRSDTVTTDRAGRYDLPHTNKFGIIVLLPFEFQTLPMQVAHPGYKTATVSVFTASEHQQQDVSLQRGR